MEDRNNHSNQSNQNDQDRQDRQDRQDNQDNQRNQNDDEAGSPLVSRTSVSYIVERSREPKIPFLSQSSVNGSHDRMSTSGLSQPRNTLASWALEIFALTLSAASITALVAVLIRENNRSITAWKFPLTLNTLAALLGAIARTSLAFAMSSCIGQQKWNWLRRRPDSVRAFERFDEASRGPWGGTRLFIWLRFRHWAALGALVTIGTVMFDPFIQALIGTWGELDETHSTSNATIGHAIRADGGKIVRFTSGGVRLFNSSIGEFTITPTLSRPDFGIVASINRGFYNSSIDSLDTVAFNCPTGNCTWPTFASVAVCSSCKDVSKDIISEAGNDWIDAHGLDHYNENLNRSRESGKNYTVFKLPYSEISNPNGLSNIIDDDWYSYSTDMKIVNNIQLMTVNNTFRSGKTLRFSDTRTMLMSFLIMRGPEDWVQSKSNWERSRVTATECALYLCVNAYQTQCDNGILKEDVLGSWAVRDKDSFSVDRERSGARDDTVKRRQATQAAQPPWVDIDIEDLYDPLDTSNQLSLLRHDLRLVIPSEQSRALPPSVPREFNVSHELIRSTIAYLQTFTGTDRDPSTYGYQQTNNTHINLFSFPKANSPPYMDALWNSTNLTTTFENVARSLTFQIRNSAPSRHQGTTQRWTIRVRVNWAYLAFPISLLTIGLTYVILTIAESTKLRVPAWKEKALPTLLYGFDDETQKLLRDDEGLKQEEKERMKVRFGHDEKDGRLGLFAPQHSVLRNRSVG